MDGSSERIQQAADREPDAIDEASSRPAAPAPQVASALRAAAAASPPKMAERGGRVVRRAPLIPPSGPSGISGGGIAVRHVIQRELDDDDRYTHRYADDDQRRELLGAFVEESVGTELDTYLETSTITEPELTALLDALIEADQTYQATPEDWLKRAIGDAHDAIEESLYANDLSEDGQGLSEAWTAAVGAGAWPLAGDAPDGFADAVEEARVAREAAEAAARAADLADAARQYQDELRAWREDGRLLAGTVHSVDQESAGLVQLRANLAIVYAAQCAATRANWLAHLECTRTNRIDGTDRCHFTTFANGVMPGVATLSTTRTTAELLAALFDGVDDWHDQIHATVVHGGKRYHRYWTGNRTGGAAPAAVTAELDAEWTRMRAFMTARVDAARAAHGRIGANRYGRQLKVADLLGG